MGDVAGNVGADHAIFEQGASAGNVGNEKLLEQKKANPVALLLSSAMMLRHLQFPSFADRLETAVKQVIKEGEYRTRDLGGHSTTQEVVDAVLASLDWPTATVLTNFVIYGVLTSLVFFFSKSS
jgi:isocitrate dehydrogenase (NAD+)